MSAYDPLSDEQREIRELVRTIARERIAPRAAEIDKTAEFPWDVVEAFRENELFGVLFDEEYGGIGESALMTLVVVEELSKVCATSGLIIAVQELGSLGIKLAGTEEQKQRFLPRLASGEWLARVCADRAGLGVGQRGDAHDGAAVTATSTCSTAASASSRTPASRRSTSSSRRPTRQQGHGGISAFMVEADAPGFEVGRIEPKMGIKGSTTGELFFNDCRVPAANLLGEEGEGFKLAMRILDRSRPGDRRAGARARPGRDRLRGRVRALARDDGQADRRAPADRGHARRHGDEVRGGPRPALQGRRDDRRGRQRARS